MRVNLHIGTDVAIYRVDFFIIFRKMDQER